jgi:hypothetical protein
MSREISPLDPDPAMQRFTVHPADLIGHARQGFIVWDAQYSCARDINSGFGPEKIVPHSVAVAAARRLNLQS